MVERFLSTFFLSMCLSCTLAHAQAGPSLGDDFIIFVNGTNTLVPNFDGTVVDDPIDASTGGKVVQYTYGNWSYSAFRFDPAVGVDLSANRADGDVFHLRLLVDPANQGKPNVELLFEDKSDGSGANDGSADLPFRLVWRVPESMRDGQWHEVSIPLPPPTWQELEDAKAAGTLDAMARHWKYAGAWSSGGFGVGVGDEMGPNTTDNPSLWKEFEWTNVASIGFFFDNNQGGGNVYVDDLYIGRTGLDLSVANDPAAPMSGVTVVADGETNRVSWTHNPAFGGYNIYTNDIPFSGLPINQEPLATLLGSLTFNAPAFEFVHRIEIPHPYLLDALKPRYAVTSLSQFGVENPDISQSAVEIPDNSHLPIQPVILELTTAEADQLLTDLASGRASGDGFPDISEPFILNQAHSSLGDTQTLPDDDADNSAMFYMGYSQNNELWVYSEVTDDIIQFGPPGTSGGDAWQFDAVEIGWGNYNVIEAGGTIIGGSPHMEMKRGEFADYIFRMAAWADNSGTITGTSTFIGSSIDAEKGSTVAEYMTDAGGNRTGYKMLSVIPLDEIQASGDMVLPPPIDLDLRLLPMTLTVNDADGSGREHQYTWSIKNNVTGQWWNTPAQWATVAMAARQTISVSSEEDADVPEDFTLDQNYPNPFNPATVIQFTLPTPERVTLSVFDVVGRTVATLVDAQPLGPGAHSVRFDASGLASGVYLYRIEAGTAFTQVRRMLLVK